MKAEDLDLTGLKGETACPELDSPEVLDGIWDSLAKAEAPDFAKYESAQNSIMESMWAHFVG